MTAAAQNNVYIVGKPKDPEKKMPQVSAQRIADASKRIAEFRTKK